MIKKFPVLITFISVFLVLASCQKEISFEGNNVPVIPPVTTPGSTTGTAAFTMAGAPGNCNNPVINGKYQVGTAMDTTDNMSVQVTVTTPGTYNITSSTNNGIQFIASGSFTSAGQKTIFFIASGTPTVAGSFSFTLGSGGCSFSIVFTAATTPPTTVNCKACSYFPICSGSKYQYLDTTYGTGSIRNADITTAGDTVISGKTFTKISSGGALSYYNCTNGESTVAGFLVVSNNGNTLQKYQSIVLKANASIGDTWSDSLLNPQGQTVVQKFLLAAKGISHQAGSFTFPDVTVVSLQTGIDLPGIGYYAITNTTYYYAKGVGLVETFTFDYTTGIQFYHSVIKSYFIP
ncbi:MAG: hypothetical protein ABJB11_06980 [Ferruginibacter sp.]